jgi:hypothetical protein
LGRCDVMGKLLLLSAPFTLRKFSSVADFLTSLFSRFGAVLEEFEVKDALNNVFATKQEVASLLQTYEVLERFG